MGIIQKQTIRNTLYTYLGAVLGFVTVGILLPRILTTDENGLLRILVSVSTLFAQFSNLGVVSVILRFFPYFRDKEKKHHGFLFYPLAVSLIGFACCMLAFFALEDYFIESNIKKSSLLTQYLLYIVPLTFFTLLYNIFDGYTRSLYNSVIGSFLKEVAQRIFILLTIALLFFDVISFPQFVTGYVASICLPTLVLMIYLILSNEWHVRPSISKLNRSLTIDMIKVSLFSIITTLSSTTISTIDSIMINDMLGLSATGIYGITFYFGTLIVIPARSLYRISSSVIADAWKNNDVGLIKRIYYMSCKSQFTVGMLLFVGIWANIDNIFYILPKEYEAGKYVILFIGLGNLIDMATGVNGVIISTSRYYRYDTLFIVLLVTLTVINNLLFIPTYGITGSAIASAFALLLFNLLRYLFLLFKFKMQPFDGNMLKILFIGALTYGIHLLLPRMHHYMLDILVRSSILSFVFGILAYKLAVSEELNKKVQEIAAFFNRGSGR